MSKIKITIEKKIDIEKHFNYMLKHIETQGQFVSYECMNRIKNIINDRKNIMFEDEFEIINPNYFG